ncbi:MAG: hypothetical protein ACSHYF_05835 [Verrucomicrobiaceae bacterium]
MSSRSIHVLLLLAGAFFGVLIFIFTKNDEGERSESELENRESRKPTTLIVEDSSGRPDGEEAVVIFETESFSRRIEETPISLLGDVEREFGVLARSDWESALKLVFEQPPGAKRIRLLQVLLSETPMRDREGLVRALLGSDVEDDWTRIGLTLNVMEVPISPATAIEMTGEGLCRSDIPALMLLDYAAIVVVRDSNGIEPALEVANSAPPQYREYMVRTIIRTYAGKSPTETLRLVLSDDQLLQDAFRKDVVKSVGQREGQNAVEFVAKNAEAKNDFQYLEGYLGTWLSADSVSVGNWANQLEEGPTKNVARKAIVNYLREAGQEELAREWESPQVE